VTLLTGAVAPTVFYLRVTGNTSPPRFAIIAAARLHETSDRRRPAGRSAIRRAALAMATALAGLLATGAVAHASVPANDNYLAATPVVGPQHRGSVDTTEAGSQTDLFQPAVAGRPSNGAQNEPLSCTGQAYDKTVWFEVQPQTTGGIHISATGYDAVIAVFEYDPATSGIIRSLGCSNASSGTTEQLTIAAPRIQQGHYYAVQVGGAIVGGVAQSGALGFALDTVPDRDSDGVSDAADPCPDAAGPGDGCPRQLPGTPRLAIAGLRIVLLEWTGLPSGTEVRATCRSCGARGLSQTVRLRRGGSARLTRFAGARARSGAVLKVFARSQPPAPGSGRFGALGKSARFRFGSGAYHWDIGCLAPGSWRQPMGCPR
jgi:hypothetical protein